MEREKLVLKVKNSSHVSSLASAFAHMVKENPGKEVEMRAVGACAVNQAIKACATARGMLASISSYSLAIIPYFDDAEIEGEKKTVICIKAVNING